jgi:hypothetical protein
MCRNCGGASGNGLCFHCRIKIDELNQLSAKTYYEDDFYGTRAVESVLHRVRLDRNLEESFKMLNQPKELFVIKF